MAEQPPPPNQPVNPPPPPGPEASRAEWHAWRRMYGRPYWMGGRLGWSFFWPSVLIVLGVYFLLSNLGLLGWLRGDVAWPIVLILFGVVLIVGRGRWWRW